jgi:phosphoenolpyruvate carboxykinase (ATP)
MHCSANVGVGDTAISSASPEPCKTTPADPKRTLIGDDDGLGRDGVFNFEGGCYAKCIKLSKEAEPEIRRQQAFWLGAGERGARRGRGSRISMTAQDREYARSPLDFILTPAQRPRATEERGDAGLPMRWVMPPIAKLSPAQACITSCRDTPRRSRGTAAWATAATGIPDLLRLAVLPLDPSVYGNMLRDLIAEHGVDCWLVNTGWTGGKCARQPHADWGDPRAVHRRADGSLRNVEFRTDKYFGFAVPTALPGVPSEILNPVNTWKDKDEFDKTVRALVGMFRRTLLPEAQVDAASCRCAGEARGELTLTMF